MRFSWRFVGNFSVGILLGEVMRIIGYRIKDPDGEIDGLTAYFFGLAVVVSYIFEKRGIYVRKMAR